MILKTKELAILQIFLDCRLPVKMHQCIDLEVLMTCNFLKTESLLLLKRFSFLFKLLMDQRTIVYFFSLVLDINDDLAGSFFQRKYFYNSII